MNFLQASNNINNNNNNHNNNDNDNNQNNNNVNMANLASMQMNTNMVMVGRRLRGNLFDRIVSFAENFPNVEFRKLDLVFSFRELSYPSSCWVAWLNSNYVSQIFFYSFY